MAQSEIQDVMLVGLERDRLEQPLAEREPVAVEEEGEAACPFLGMAGRESERARALELAAELLVFAFGGLDDSGVEALQRPHALEHGVDGAGEVGSIWPTALGSAPLHSVICDFRRARARRLVAAGFRQAVERRLVLDLQGFERHLMAVEEAQRRGIEQRRARARVEERRLDADQR